MIDDGARLDAARRRLVASFSAQQSTDALVEVASHLGLLGNALLTDSLKTLSAAVQATRQEQAAAMEAYEDAFTDRMTALAGAEHLRVTALAEAERGRIFEMLTARHAAILEIRDALHNMAELIGYPIITPACDALVNAAPRPAPPARVPPPGHDDPEDYTP